MPIGRSASAWKAAKSTARSWASVAPTRGSSRWLSEVPRPWPGMCFSTEEEGPSAEELADHLAFQLERLAAMREAAARLMGRDRLGRDVFARGMPEGISTHRNVMYQATLLDLMQAYARIRTKDDFRPYVMDRDAILTMEQALDRLRGMIAFAGQWSDLSSYLPVEWQGDAARRRSSLAATFAATLELAKEGRVEIRQSDIFGLIELRKKPE
ncbi:segregation and condensation protein A [Mangrovicoccus ximenensis]|uniref:segregation and condensation protein A n=1 Tax=Mangrovicoccus ximenensis TaxID=1911570 RepID=UPI001F2AD05B|nr:hypothetical protein [Mangrovicoccus ximenensis]